MLLCMQVCLGYIGGGFDIVALRSMFTKHEHVKYGKTLLAHSSMLYAELTLSETMEHWLSCQRNAFEFFDGVPAHVRVGWCRAIAMARA